MAKKASLPECREVQVVKADGYSNAVCFAKGDGWLLAADFGVPKIYDLAAGNQKGSFAKSGIPDNDGVCWTIAQPSTRHVVAGVFASVVAWTADGSKVERVYPSPSGIVSSIGVTPGDKTIVFGTWMKMLVAVDFKSGRELWSVTDKKSFSSRVAVTLDGKHCVTGGNDKSVRLFELATGREVQRIGDHDGYVQGLAVLPDGERVATAGRDRTIRIWDIRKAKLLATFEGHRKEIRALAVTADGRLAVSAGGDGVRVWDLKTNGLVATFNGHDTSVACLSLASNGKLAATGGDDGHLRVWELPH